MLMARAAQMVWTWSPCSGARPGDNSNSKSAAGTGALATRSSASLELAAGGMATGTEELVGLGADTEEPDGAGLLWAPNMAAETATDAATANQRPRPLAKTLFTEDSLERRVSAQCEWPWPSSS